MNSKRALLLSGGMDSTALAYWLRPEIALTLDYGQHAADAEIVAASKVAEVLGIEHYVLKADCSMLGSGDLSKNKPADVAPKSDWWPFRNQMLATLCGMAAINMGVTELLIGSVKGDEHKDGCQEFYNLLSQLMAFQEGNMIVSAPAIALSTEELIRESCIPKEILMWSHSCHKSATPCGSCRGCNKYYGVLVELEKKIYSDEVS